MVTSQVKGRGYLGLSPLPSCQRHNSSDGCSSDGAPRCSSPPGAMTSKSPSQSGNAVSCDSVIHLQAQLDSHHDGEFKMKGDARLGVEQGVAATQSNALGTSRCSVHSTHTDTGAARAVWRLESLSHSLPSISSTRTMSSGGTPLHAGRYTFADQMIAGRRSTVRCTLAAVFDMHPDIRITRNRRARHTCAHHVAAALT